MDKLVSQSKSYDSEKRITSGPKKAAVEVLDKLTMPNAEVDEAEIRGNYPKTTEMCQKRNYYVKMLLCRNCVYVPHAIVV